MISNSKYRAYFFVNANYMKEVQWGLQSAHVLAELYEKYLQSTRPAILHLREWAAKHKTIIILNGGNHLELTNLSVELGDLANTLELPHACFCEDVASLNGATTCVGVILPDTIYDLNLDVIYGVHDLPLYPSTDTPKAKIKKILTRYSLA